MAATDGSEYLAIQVDDRVEHFERMDSTARVEEDEEELLWAAIERLPSAKRLNYAIMRRNSTRRFMNDPESRGKAPPSSPADAVDVTKLDRRGRQILLKNALATDEQDNYNLLAGIKARLDTVGLEVPKVEVRFKGFNVSANVHVGSRALPSVPNFFLNAAELLLTSLRILQPKKRSLTILNNVSGVVKPGRMTLLLGPPASGKSTLLLALAGKLDSNLQVTGEMKYNGKSLNEFCVGRTSAYISQTDNHIGELTVRETLDFAARCQGANDNFADHLKDLARLEKERNIRPSPEIDAFMKATSVVGKKHNLATDYVLKVLGLDVCSDTQVGSDMVRGVSGGQRKRVTTGEMVVGPRKTLFMDEISTGLDSSTTYQIVKCMQNFVHQMEATVLISLLQPAPETFDLFDDIILLSDGHIIYQGPREHVIEFFESLGFLLPPRKGVADFLQEVTSKKDQAQYWSNRSKPYNFIPVSKFTEAFKLSEYGKSIDSSLSAPNGEMKFLPSSLARSKYALSKLDLFKACFSREFLLIKRHRFLYIFRTGQVTFVGIITCTMFPRSKLQPLNEINGNLYLNCLFFGLVHMMFNGFSELPITISRLPVFYKQRDNRFHPSWAFTVSSWILRIPYSILEAVVWSCVVYYSVGFASSPVRFFRFMFLLFSIHQMALGLFRMMGALARDMIVANTFGSAAILAIFLLGGFIVPKDAIKPWLMWAYWVSPLTYGQKGISVNEFTDPRWAQISALGGNSVGVNVLLSHSLPIQQKWYWIGVGVLLGYSIIFNILLTLAMAYLQPLGSVQAVITPDAIEKDANEEASSSSLEMLNDVKNHSSESSERKVTQENMTKRGMILPFQPLSMTFHKLNYFVEMPKEMRLQGAPESKLQLLSNVNGVFRPGVLTALVGSSGAGKTTLMDVLAGRKTGGYIEGDIKISGYAKEHSTFARVSGYVEQNDIHSPQVTVEESLWFSSSLRLPSEISGAKRHEFVEQVMALVELDTLRHALVGLPGSTGLSTEQRKRLTIAVELVANPSVVFMDEPTSGLDARAAAIVMRTVRNTVDTGRTVICTIHQPSIDIFEAFDELLLMKRGGQVIYGGMLGVNSQIMINYFQGINGVPQIPDGYNPATWMLEISTPVCESRLDLDFATIYKNSDRFREVEALIHQLGSPVAGTEPLRFSSEFSQDVFTQFTVCYRKQNLVYWRSPQYNAIRLLFTAGCALIFGAIFWNVGMKRERTQDLFLVMGGLYAACLFLGVNNASSVQPIISVERTVFYREKAARMYSPFPYAAAQGLVEIPYIAIQTLLFGVITYFMINYERTLGKFLMYLVFMFLTFTYFTFYGIMAVGLTPSQHLAAVVSSAFYSLWNLASGFLVPKPNIPSWWIWFYYASPVGWTLRGIITSQLGDVETRLVGNGFNGTVKEYLGTSLGYEPQMTGISVLVLACFSIFFFTIYAISIKLLNFQKR